MLVDAKSYPNAARLLKELVKRNVVTARSILQPTPLSDAAFTRIDSGATPRRDVVVLLKAREAEVARSERLAKRRSA